MSDINTIALSGRLGEDPKMKYFESGNVVCEVSIGVNKYSAKQKKEIVTWHKCRAWGKNAEFICGVAKVGALVFVQGTLEKDTYKAEDGSDRSISYILVQEIKVINKKDNQG